MKPAMMALSGDAAVDRRYEYALQMAARGEIKEAIDLLEQSLELAPHWPPLLFKLGLLSPHKDKAAAYYRAYLQCDPADHMGATLKLALMERRPPDQLPPGYVRALFDQYAPRFDDSLQNNLAYAVPGAMRDMIDTYRPASSSEDILDLGCGTGLSGGTLRQRAKKLTGVDLSKGMIAQARAKHIYDQLHVASIDEFLPAAPSYDLIAAADVLVYCGALDGLMKQVASALRPNGLFIFSVQQADGDGFVLGDDHRYAHAQGYVDRCLIDAGLVTRQCRALRVRTDGLKNIMGYLILAEKLA